MLSIRSSIITTILAAIITTIPAAALAQDQAHIIKYRKMVMKSIGGHMGAISTNTKGNLGHAADVKEHARALHSAMKMVPHAFKGKTDGGETTAIGKIWEDWDGFSKAQMNAEKAAADLVAAVNAGDSNIGPKLKALGKTCGGCHKKYRKKKKS